MKEEEKKVNIKKKNLERSLVENKNINSDGTKDMKTLCCFAIYEITTLCRVR